MPEWSKYVYKNVGSIPTPALRQAPYRNDLSGPLGLDSIRRANVTSTWILGFSTAGIYMVPGIIQGSLMTPRNRKITQIEPEKE